MDGGAAAAEVLEPRLGGQTPAAWWSARHPVGRAARLGAIAGLFGCAVAFNVPLCPFALLTGQPCPGCGLTRATLALLRGDLGDAVRFHPLSVLLSPIAIAAFAYNG